MTNKAKRCDGHEVGGVGLLVDETEGPQIWMSRQSSRIRDDGADLGGDAMGSDGSPADGRCKAWPTHAMKADAELNKAPGSPP